MEKIHTNVPAKRENINIFRNELNLVAIVIKVVEMNVDVVSALDVVLPLIDNEIVDD